MALFWDSAVSTIAIRVPKREAYLSVSVKICFVWPRPWALLSCGCGAEHPVSVDISAEWMQLDPCTETEPGGQVLSVLVESDSASSWCS